MDVDCPMDIVLVNESVQEIYNLTSQPHQVVFEELLLQAPGARYLLMKLDIGATEFKAMKLGAA